MCAIAGYLGLGSPGNLEAMAAAMAHRGPDGEGFFSDPSAAIGLAHRRLSIIDPTAAAAQPMVSCGGRYRVVFNGEIYNFREIARELIAAGYEFNVNSDTAVLGPLYDRYETQAFGRLNGIFAIAIWDANRRELVVARDGFGVKPLYYAKARGLFAFASELKALLTFPSIAGKLDVAALLDYLVNLWSPGCSTPFQNIHKLLPGHFIRARLDAFEIVRWYAPPLGRSELSRRNDIGSIGQNLRDAFDRAVTRQCLSDVPIGAFLSGGVDSSAVVASMVKSANPPKRTYCIAFDGPSMLDEGFGDDFAHARMLADRLSVPLTKIAVQEPGAEELASLPFMLDEPQADPAALYVAAIAKAARRDGIKVLLAGTGGDDILSGYRRHRLAALRDRLAAWRILIPAGVLRASDGRGPLQRRLARLGYLLDCSDEDFLAKSFETNRRALAESCLSAEALAAIKPRVSWLEQASAVSKGKKLLDRMLYLELHGFLPDHNLNYTDKAAMAQGVEVRVPFLDSELAELASGIPPSLKMRGLREKWIFKKAMADRLPAPILRRKKTGFGAPVRVWLRRGRLREVASDVISSKRFRERGLFHQAAVQSLFRDTVRGTVDGAYLVLALLMVEFWLQHFVDRSAAHPALNRSEYLIA